MHEYYKALEWVGKVSGDAEESDKTKVKTLHVTFGESSGYSPEIVKSYFDEAAKGTPCEGAEFDVKMTRSMLKCPKCGHVYEKKLLDYKCPKCGTEGEMTESGNEVELNSVDYL